MWMAVYCVVLQVAQAAQADYYDEYYGNEGEHCDLVSTFAQIAKVY